MYPPIFHEFARKESTSDGRSVYDFLGGAIDAAYKRGWQKNVLPKGTKVKPGYPSASEWTVDWIACLLSARLAGERFAVVELGAGYGQWMVTAIMAYKALYPERPAHGMALEADDTHYQWLKEHVTKNIGRFDNVETDLFYAAAGFDGVAQFPVLAEPERDYGAAYQRGSQQGDVQRVPCLSMRSIDHRFAEATIDLLHVDIQGAERDLIVNPGFDSVLAKTRFALFGTHLGNDLHAALKKSIESSGMEILIEWPRNSELRTPFGDIQTNDGAILATAPELSGVYSQYLSPHGH